MMGAIFSAGLDVNMQILMSEQAHERVRDRLAAFGERVDVVCIGVTAVGELTFSRNGQPIPASEVDPEIYWVSLDLWPAGRLPHFFRQMMKGTKGQWAQVFSAGLDNPIFGSMMSRGLRLTKSRAQAIAIVEYVVAHAVSLLHPIAEQAAAQAAHDWRRVTFREINATHWVIVGFGAIGEEIAKRARAFGVKITVVRRSVAPDPLADDVLPMEGLNGALGDADVVVLACALNDETRNMADQAFFASLKPGAILINIGRGDLVDEDALRAGLDRNQPAHAVLDVFHTEPLPQDAWFWDHPKVRVTAHASNAGDGVLARGDAQFLENLARFLEGRPLLAEARPEEAGV